MLKVFSTNSFSFAFHIVHMNVPDLPVPIVEFQAANRKSISKGSFDALDSVLKEVSIVPLTWLVTTQVTAIWIGMISTTFYAFQYGSPK